MSYDLTFMVHVAEEGEEVRVDDVMLTSSTLHLPEVEACMSDALYRMRAPLEVLALRRRNLAPDFTVASEGRALFGQAQVVLLLEAATFIVLAAATYHVVVQFARDTHHTKRRPHPATSDSDAPRDSGKESKPDSPPEGDPKTTGPTPPIPPEPPGPPKPKPRCEVAFPQFVNCSYIQQAKYPGLKAAIEAVIKSLPGDRQKRPFATRRTELSNDRQGTKHTTYYSADGRTKITIGCYETCCKNTQDGPVLEEGMKCYEHNTAYLR